MKHKFLKLMGVMVFVWIATYSTSSYAWSLFGPKNFDDCILAGMKGVTSDYAAKVVHKSCLDKFPNDKPKESSRRWGTPRVDIWNERIGNLLVSKVDLLEWKGKFLKVTNNNNFEISGIYLGVPKDSSACQANKGDYKEIYLCTGLVPANLTGTFDCSTLPKKVKICLTGLLGPRYVEDLDKWFKKVGN